MGKPIATSATKHRARWVPVLFALWCLLAIRIGTVMRHGEHLDGRLVLPAGAWLLASAVLGRYLIRRS